MTGVSTEWYLYLRLPPPQAPSGYTFQCGPFCRCQMASSAKYDRDIGQCAECAGLDGFIFAPFGPPAGMNGLVQNDGFQTIYNWYLYAPSIHTSLLQRYTLLSQGTFSLWYFSGVETNFHSEEIGGTKKFPVFPSIGKPMHTIQVASPSQRACFSSTSQEDRCDKCSRSLHRTVSGKRKGNEEWTVVQQVHNELISVPDGGEYVTGFDLSRTVTSPHGHRFPNRVRFNMNTKDGKSDIAVLSLSCRPNHNINVQISIKHKSDQQFGDGELKVARKSLSTLQTSTDSEFSVDSKWQELGGSEQAARYLQLVD